MALPQIDRPLGVAIAILHLKGLWGRVGNRVLDAAPLVVVVAAVLYILLQSDRSLEKLALAAGCVAIALGLRSAIRPRAAFVPLALPKSLADAGLTGEAAARRIIDAAIRALDGAEARGVPNPFKPFEPLPRLEVPGFKLDPDVFGDLLRELFCRPTLLCKPRLRIGGEIVAAADLTLTVRLRGSDGALLIDHGPVPSAEPERLFATAAEALLAYAAPYNLAYARQHARNVSGALEAAQAGAENAALADAVRARCRVLCWHNLRALGRLEAAAAALSRAAASACTDLMVAAAVGEHLNLNRETSEAEPNRAAWVRLAAVATSWTRGVEDLDHFSIESATAAGEFVVYLRDRAAESIRWAETRLQEAERSCLVLELAAFHPRATLKEVGEAALSVDHYLEQAQLALDQARKDDPDASVALDATRIESERDRIATMRSALDDERVRQGVAKVQGFVKEANRFIASLGEIASGAARDLAAHKERWREGSIFLAARSYRQCVQDAWVHYDRRGSGGMAFYRYWSLIDAVLALSGELETMATKPDVIRSDPQKLRRLLLGIERLGRWLIKTPPTVRPSFVPTLPAPEEPAAPDVRTSAVMQTLRAGRARAAAEAARMSGLPSP